MHEDFTYGSRYMEKEKEKILEDLFKFSTNTDVSWDKIKERGIARWPKLGRRVELGAATDWKPGETITPYKWHIEGKMIWPTLTRRMQFYIDHDLYLELGDELPLHKDNPSIGGNYTLQMTEGHTRWSIHTSWRDHSYMLKLRRG